MATRSAGTGIIATLVLFVVTTVGLLVAVVLLFNAKGAVERDRDERVNSLRTTQQQLSSLEETAQTAAQVLGTSSISEADLRSTLGLSPSDRASAAIAALRRAGKDAEARIAELQSQLEQAQTSLETEREAYADARTTFDNGLSAARAEIASIKDIADQFSAQLDELRGQFARTSEDLSAEFEGRRTELEEQLEEAHRVQARLTDQVSQLTETANRVRARAQDASTLVDAHIVDISPDGTTLFLDLGRRDRLRPGMTFEVYTDATQITTASAGGDSVPLPGKATVEVTRVGDTTSQARVVRLSPRAAVASRDVLANPLYSPDHEYAFLVHGLFDVDGDGLGTEGEADIVRRRIADWNGRVLDGEGIRGDVDFIVVGIKPPPAVSPSASATDLELAQFARREEQREKYELLLKAAAEAQIPVLNWNRLQVLTGDGGR